MYQYRRFNNKNGFFQKFGNLDYILLSCLLILGFISLATMYSTDGGEVLFHTRSHFIKFVVFFSMMLVISFINIKFWFSLGYLSYAVILGMLIWTINFGIAIILIGLIKPNLLSKPYKLWISLGNKLAWINSHIILGIVFIVILQPIAYLMKINGYDPLRKKRFNKMSYREIRKNYSVDFTKIF